MAGWSKEDLHHPGIMYVSCYKHRVTRRPKLMSDALVMIKKYTEDHEWIEMDEGDKIGQ